MGKRAGARGERIVIEPGDNPWKIAVECVQDGRRWPELVAANPQKTRAQSGNFASLMPGEVLALPGSWLVKMGGMPVTPIVVSPGAAEIGSLHDAGAFEPSPRARSDAGALPSVLPYGWRETDVQIVTELERQWDLSVGDLFSVWYSESGLDPRKVAPDPFAPNVLYYGLNMARPSLIDPEMKWPAGTWRTIVNDSPIATQLQALAQFYDHVSKRYLGESFPARAAKVGVSGAAMLYMMNFLPGVAPRATNRDFVMARQGDATLIPGTSLTYGQVYKSNPSLDMNKDGVITPADFDAVVARNRTILASSGPGKALLAAAKEVARAPLATLFAPIAGEWQDLTGKAPIVTVGYGGGGSMPYGSRGAGLLETIALIALVGAAAYYGAPYVMKWWRG